MDGCEKLLLEPDKPRAKWKSIVVGHLVLYGLSLILVIVADLFFYNRGDAALVYSGFTLLTIASYIINRTHAPRRALLLTVMLSPGSLLIIFMTVLHLLNMLGVIG